MEYSPPVPEVQVPADGFEHHERIVVVAGQERHVPETSRGRYEALRFIVIFQMN
jgi:hypothetical protein